MIEPSTTPSGAKRGEFEFFGDTDTGLLTRDVLLASRAEFKSRPGGARRGMVHEQSKPVIARLSRHSACEAKLCQRFSGEAGCGCTLEHRHWPTRLRVEVE